MHDSLLLETNSLNKTFILSKPSTWTNAQTVDEFRSQIKYVRAFHGCRPLSIDAFKRNGFKMPDKEMLSQLTFNLLGNHVDREKLKQAISEHWERYPAKGIYFALDKKMLLNECGHYIIYGSEFVCGIAAEFWCQRVLKERGIPTVITADIPVEMIEDFTITELIEKINDDFDEADMVDFGFRLTEPLPSQYIVKIEHPKKVPDPLNNYYPYYHVWK